MKREFMKLVHQWNLNGTRAEQISLRKDGSMEGERARGQSDTFKHCADDLEHLIESLIR